MGAIEKRYWSVVTPQPAAQIVEFSKQAEQAGIEGLWGIQLPGPAFLPLATAAAGTERVKLGTGISLAFVRTPLETATSALDLDVISGGRTVLGIGPSVQFVNENWHGIPYEKPLARLRETVTLVRRIIEQGHTGEFGKYEGEFYSADLTGIPLPKPVRPSIPIYLPALFSRAAHLAGEIGDGLAGHPIWSLKWIQDTVVPAVSEGLQQSGKSRQDFDLNLWSYVAIHADRKQAIDDARGQVSFYSSIAQYEKYFAAHGFGDAARKAAEAAQRGDMQATRNAIPDEMVETFSIAGTPDEVQERLAAVWQVADSVTVFPPSAFLKPDQVAAYQRAIFETVYQV